MAATIASCPTCQARIRLPEGIAGQEKVRCGSCGVTFLPGPSSENTMTLKQVAPPPSVADSSTPSEEETHPPAPRPQETVTFAADRLRSEGSSSHQRGPLKETGGQRGTSTTVGRGETNKQEQLKDGPRLPGYEILEVLGRGGMGVVYKARQQGLNRLVAVKMILGGGHAGAEGVSRFRMEAEAVARLQHPQIVQIYEVGEQDGLPYFSLEYCPGGSLARKTDGTPMDPREAAALIERLARGVHAAHQQNVIHRDLKPANILLTGEGEPKITDFGLAKRLDDAGQTQSGAVMGTPSYMAPEQARGDLKAIGPRTDVYSLGAILYELLTGRPPFKSSTPMDTVMLVIHEEPVAPSQLQPKIPRDLETICLKCLQKSSEARYASAENLAEELERFRNRLPILARPVGRIERTWRWGKRNPLVAGLLASVVLLLAAGASVGWYLAWEANEARYAADRAAQEAKDLALVAQTNEDEARKEKVRADLEAQRASEQAALALKNATKARAESARASKVADFLVGLFDSADPIGYTGYAFGPDPNHGARLTAKAILDRGKRKAEKELEGQPELRAALLTTIGSVYRTMGLTEESRPLLEEGLRLRLANLGADHLEVAESWYHLGWMFQQDGDEHQALQCYAKAEAIAKKQEEGAALYSRCRFNTAWILAQRYANDQAEIIFREVLEERRKRLGDEHFEVGVAQGGLAAVYFQSGRALAAAPLVLSAMEIFKKSHGDKSFAAAANLGQNALLAMTFGNYDEAEKNFLQVADLMGKLLGDNHPYVAWAYGFLGEIMAQAGRGKDSERYYARCLQISKDGLGLAHPLVLRAIEPYAGRLAGSGRYDDACQVYEEALEHQRKRRGEKHPILVQTLGSYGFFAQTYGRGEEADQHYRRAVKMARDLPPGSCPLFAEILGRLASQLQLESPGEAIELYQEALKAAPDASNAHQLELELKLGLARIYFDLHWYEPAVPLLEGLALEPKGKARTDLSPLIDNMTADLPRLLKEEAPLLGGEIGLACSPSELTPFWVAAASLLRRLEGVVDVPVQALHAGEIRKDQLSAKDPLESGKRDAYHKIFSVSLEAGQTYQMVLRSKEFDAYLRLENQAGRSLAADDDGAGGLDSRILYRCKVPGAYRLVVTTFKPLQVGAFTLQVETVRDKALEKVLFRKEERLASTDPLDGARIKSHHKAYNVELEAGKTYRIDLRSEVLDCFLRIEDAAGMQLAQDDDGGGMLNARLLFTPPATGTYRLIATTFKDRQVGPFVLTVVH